jgi:hypothetical protein
MTLGQISGKKNKRNTAKEEFEICRLYHYVLKPVVKYKILSFKVATIWKLLQIPLNATI